MAGSSTIGLEFFSEKTRDNYVTASLPLSKYEKEYMPFEEVKNKIERAFGTPKQLIKLYFGKTMKCRFIHTGEAVGPVFSRF